LAKNKKQKPKLAFKPRFEKKPTIGAVNPSAYLSEKPMWRLRSMRTKDPYGWHSIERDEMLIVIERLKSFETMTWQEVERSGSHWISCDEICKDAQGCLEEDWQGGAEQVFSLRMGGKPRVWGIIDERVFYILWFDPNHQICPAPKKHT
jgi:hypothetical protein